MTWEEKNPPCEEDATKDTPCPECGGHGLILVRTGRYGEQILKLCPRCKGKVDER